MWLRQSTAGQEVLLGPFLDSTDGNTAETGLTVANTDIKIWKEGGTTESNKNSGGATHIAGGRYYAVLDATDTDTLGKLEINCHVSGALAVRREFMIVPAMIYDSMILGTDRLDTNTTHVADTAQTANDNGADINAILVDTAEIGAAGAGLTALASQASVDTVDSNVDAILVDTNELQTNQGNWLTATGFATPADLTTIDTNVDAILVDTGTIIPGQISGLNDLSAAEVNAEVDTALSDYDGPTRAEATADKDEILAEGGASWTTGAGGSPPQLLQSTTIATLASQTSFTLTAGSADNDAYNGAVVVVTDASTSTQKAVGSVSDYVGSTRTVTLSSDPGVFTMAASDLISIIANASTAPSAAAVRAEIDNNSTQLAAIIADTNELQTNQGNWATATGFATAAALATVDSNVDAILVDTGTTIPGQISGLNDVSSAEVNAACDTALSDYDGPTRAEATADKDEILTEGGASWVTGSGSGLDAAGVRSAIGMSSANLDSQLSAIDSNVDAVLVDTGSTLPGILNALNDFDPTSDIVARVTLVDTTTVNSDMRGTDGANTVSPNNSDIAAIKTKTDSLVFTKTNQVDVNIQSINGVTITGNGGSTPFDV